MRKVLLMLCVAFGMGCSNGLNKPIIETLSVDELKAYKQKLMNERKYISNFEKR